MEHPQQQENEMEAATAVDRRMMPPPLFAKRLRWQCGEAEHAEFLTITPEMAAEMMKRNVDEDYRNRPLTKNAVRRYARAMTEGRWVVTGEPIVFSSDGVLLNGQHRLTGCLESGIAIRTLVVYGIDRAAFKHMDRGLKRTGSDVFAIEGIPNATVAAAALIWIKRIAENNGIRIAPVSRPENDQLIEWYYSHEGLQDSVWVMNAISTAGEHLASPSMMVALHYLFAQKSRRDADDFMEQIITGAGIAKGSPEHALRNFLIKDNAPVAGRRTDDAFRAAYIAMAWNARRTDKRITLFRWRTEQVPNASFPTIR